MCTISRVADRAETPNAPFGLVVGVAKRLVQDQHLAIDATDGAVMVDDAKVVQADVGADNGVIHVIDAVIMPKM